MCRGHNHSERLLHTPPVAVPTHHPPKLRLIPLHSAGALCSTLGSLKNAGQETITCSAPMRVGRVLQPLTAQTPMAPGQGVAGHALACSHSVTPIPSRPFVTPGPPSGSV